MKTTAAKLLAARLHQAGCRHAFGMPGGEVLNVMQELDQAGIEFTLCKHENAAGFMAEGAYQASGAPAILLTTIGPGLANGLNSVANAFQEQVPLFVISGCVDDSEAQSFTHQIIDQKALLEPITKASFQVSAASMGKIVDKAIAIALADPPGPVHIDIPHNIAQTTLEYNFSPLSLPIEGVWPDGKDLNLACEKIKNAGHPIIIAGLGALHHNAGGEILKLCDTRSIPLITTYKAKGIVDENHPLVLGGHGLSPRSDAIILPLLAQSDCIILAGYDPIEMRSGWIDPWKSQNAIDIIHADIQHGMHGADIRFVGNIEKSLAKINHQLSKQDPFERTPSWPGGQVARARSALDQIFCDKNHWGAHKIFATIGAKIPKSSIVSVDSGAHRILLSQMWKCTAPRTLLQSTAFCTMGVSLPLAIGYAKATSLKGGSQIDSYVVVFVGDAGLEMVMGELATLRDMEIPIIIIVLVDNSLALIDLKQSRSNLPKLGVDFGATDFVSIAQAYGGNGQWVEDNETLEIAVDDAIKAEKFTILACKIDKQCYQEAF